MKVFLLDNCRSRSRKRNFFSAPAPAPAKNYGSGRLRLRNTNLVPLIDVFWLVIGDTWNPSHLTRQDAVIIFFIS